MNNFFIAACCSAGQKKYGVNLGPLNLNLEYNSIISSESFYNDGYQILYDTVYKNMDKFVVTIGGDHSIAVGSIGAINDYYNNVKNKKIFVLWIDAHADINTYETSVSQNIHGMPVAFLMKLCEQNIVNLKTKLNPEQIIYIGVRDIDPPEKEILDKYNIKYYTMQYIITHGIIKLINELNEIIGDNDIHVSLDIDGIDPKYCPSTGLVVENGLCPTDINIICNCFVNQIVSCDIVEYNPYISSFNETIKTSKNIMKILKNIISNKKNIL